MGKNFAARRLKRATERGANRGDVVLGKLLKDLLRHKAKDKEVSVAISQDGWVELDAALTYANSHGHVYTREDIVVEVGANSKARFELSADGQRIRAAQGHTIAGVAQDIGKVTSDQQPPLA